MADNLTINTQCFSTKHLLFIQFSHIFVERRKFMQLYEEIQSLKWTTENNYLNQMLLVMISSDFLYLIKGTVLVIRTRCIEVLCLRLLYSLKILIIWWPLVCLLFFYSFSIISHQSRMRWELCSQRYRVINSKIWHWKRNQTASPDSSVFSSCVIQCWHRVRYNWLYIPEKCYKPMNLGW